MESTLTVLKSLLDRIEEILARLDQRTNEKLTRRVWNDKDIYLRDVNRRVMVSRDIWAEMVKWKMWEGNVTGLPRKFEGVGRWTDQRLAARIRSKELLSEVI